MSVTAYDIKAALGVRHAADFFTTECMDGPARSGGFRFDAVAIAKSWTRPTFTGYEVKVSRSDFKADSKFYAYLPYFHELYIACPKGMITREELPESIGLIWYDPETGAVRAKKRAVYRNIEINVEMLLHIFYSHMSSDRTPFSSTRTEYAQRLLETKSIEHDIGRHLGSKLARKIEEQDKLLQRYEHKSGDLKKLESVEKVLREHGIYTWRGDDLADQLNEALSRAYPKALDNIADSLHNCMERLDQICKERKTEPEGK